MSLLDTIVQTDLVHYTTDTSPTIQRREVYIAIRNDTLLGSGTADDPYNGSTDDILDKLLGDLLGDLFVISAYTTIRFGPGTFQTKGTGWNRFWVLKNGYRLIGAGMYQTTIQLVKAAPGTAANQDFATAIGSFTTFLQDVEISDMTVDANLHRQPLDGTGLASIRCDAITMIGTNQKIRRVRAINWGTHVTPSNGDREGFPFYVQGTGDTLTTGNVDNLIEDCIIEQPDRNPAREVTLNFRTDGTLLQAYNTSTGTSTPELATVLQDADISLFKR